MPHQCQICGDTRIPSGITARLWCPGCGQEYTTSPGLALVLSDEQLTALKTPPADAGRPHEKFLLRGKYVDGRLEHFAGGELRAALELDYVDLAEEAVPVRQGEAIFIYKADEPKPANGIVDFAQQIKQQLAKKP